LQSVGEPIDFLAAADERWNGLHKTYETPAAFQPSWSLHIASPYLLAKAHRGSWLLQSVASLGYTDLYVKLFLCKRPGTDITLGNRHTYAHERVIIAADISLIPPYAPWERPL
jgi:hypothetical protein